MISRIEEDGGEEGDDRASTAEYRGGSMTEEVEGRGGCGWEVREGGERGAGGEGGGSRIEGRGGEEEKIEEDRGGG